MTQWRSTLTPNSEPQFLNNNSKSGMINPQNKLDDVIRNTVVFVNHPTNDIFMLKS
jgi:hypothetical protein